MDLGLQGKVAVITGGSVGIGLAVARGLAQEGVHVALCARDEARVIEQARAIREEFGVRALGLADNIRVNLINPGLIMTPDWQKTAKLLTQGKDITWEQYLDRIAKDNAPIGRFATPEELAHFFVFLCSPRASYCVGSSYYVDGGWLNVVN